MTIQSEKEFYKSIIEEYKIMCQADDQTPVMLDEEYNKGIIGYSYDDYYHLIYDYDKLVEAYVNDNQCSHLSAEELFSYNDLEGQAARMGEGHPIIIHRFC